MRTWTPPLLLLATLATIAWKPRATLKLIGGVALGAILLAASTAVAGWLTWQAILYLIHHSR
jgi:orotate phosphoribosyltransferase